MRKDMRLGLAVGGVLAIVVLTYAVLFSGSRDKNKKGGDTPQQASGAGGSSTGGGGQGSAGALPSAGRTGEGSPGVSLGSGTGNSGRNSANQGSSAGQAGSGTGAGIGGTPEAGSTGTAQPPRGWNWAAALRTGAGGAVPHTETPDPNRNSTPEPNPWRPREDSVSNPATRPAGTDGGQVSRQRLERPREEPSGGGSAPSGPKKRIVKSGESYWTIAKEEYGSAVYVSHLIRANPGVDPKTLKAGATITVPAKSEVVPAGVTERTLAGGETAPAQIDPAKQYRVQPGDNLSVISKKLYGKADRVEEIYELNKDVIGPNKSALKRDMVLVLPEPPTTRQGG